MGLELEGIIYARICELGPQRREQLFEDLKWYGYDITQFEIDTAIYHLVLARKLKSLEHDRDSFEIRCEQ